MRNIIVTGASGNLGQAVVKKMLAEGFYVVGTIIPNDPTTIAIEDKNFETAAVDLMNEEAAGNFVTETTATRKTISAAVLTVGGFAMGTIAETKTGDIVKQYKLNFETTYNVARPVFMQMMKQGSGRLFLIGSQPGIDMKNSSGKVAYGLAKSLIFRLAELMNEEAEGTDVITCVVVPSTIDTSQNRNSMPDADFSKWITPEKIAEDIFLNCIADENVRLLIEY